MSSEEHDADDMSIYHPHDLLIVKFFPDEDLSSIDYDSIEYSELYAAARDFLKWRATPRRIPWPLPPVRPRESQQAGVEEWRSKALQVVNSRIALFTPGPTQQHAVTTQACPTSISPGNHVPTHRLLLIPEMLELILRQAKPQTKHAAWDVNHLWRSTIEHILAHQYRSYHRCPPVEYGERIDMDTDLSYMQPSDAEIAIVEQEAISLSQKPLQELMLYYYPANIAQANSLSDGAYLAIQVSYERLRWKPAESDPIDRSGWWLDFSQIRINPHIAELFGERMEIKLGRCEIALEAGANQPCLLQGSLPSGNFAELVADMFLTEPPCKELCIYMNKFHSADLQLLARVYDEDGIRVRLFLAALQDHAEELLARWIGQANILRWNLRESHWTEFSTAKQKCVPWYQAPATLAKKAYNICEDIYTVRKNE